MSESVHPSLGLGLRRIFSWMWERGQGLQWGPIWCFLFQMCNRSLQHVAIWLFFCGPQTQENLEPLRCLAASSQVTSPQGVCAYVASVSCRTKKFYETLNFLMHSCSMHALTLASTLMHLPLSICHDLGKELMWSKVVWSMICWIHWACSTAWSRPYDAKFVDWGFSRCLVIPLIGWAPVSTADTSHIPGAIVNMYGFEMAMC